MLYLSALYMLRNVLLVKSTTLYTIKFSISALYMLRNVLIVKLENCTVNYMYSLSALYMLQYVPIVTYSCKLLYSKKKKQKTKKKKQKRPVLQLCHKNPAIYLFSWEREGILTSPKLYIKN